MQSSPNKLCTPVSDIEKCKQTKVNTKCRFWSQLKASSVSSHTEELWHNEIVCPWIYIYIVGLKESINCGLKEEVLDLSACITQARVLLITRHQSFSLVFFCFLINFKFSLFLLFVTDKVSSINNQINKMKYQKTKRNRRIENKDRKTKQLFT